MQYRSDGTWKTKFPALATLNKLEHSLGDGLGSQFDKVCPFTSKELIRRFHKYLKPSLEMLRQKICLCVQFAVNL